MNSTPQIDGNVDASVNYEKGPGFAMNSTAQIDAEMDLIGNCQKG